MYISKVPQNIFFYKLQTCQNEDVVIYCVYINVIYSVLSGFILNLQVGFLRKLKPLLPVCTEFCTDWLVSGMGLARMFHYMPLYSPEFRTDDSHSESHDQLHYQYKQESLTHKKQDSICILQQKCILKDPNKYLPWFLPKYQLFQ